MRFLGASLYTHTFMKNQSKRLIASARGILCRERPNRIPRTGKGLSGCPDWGSRTGLSRTAAGHGVSRTGIDSEYNET